MLLLGTERFDSSFLSLPPPSALPETCYSPLARQPRGPEQTKGLTQMVHAAVSESTTGERIVDEKEMKGRTRRGPVSARSKILRQQLGMCEPLTQDSVLGAISGRFEYRVQLISDPLDWLGF